VRSALVEEVQNVEGGVFDLVLDCLVTSVKFEGRALCPLGGLEIAQLIARETLRNAALRSWVWIPVMLDFFWPYIEMLYMGVGGFQFLALCMVT
jgi:hypothetical protein